MIDLTDVLEIQTAVPAVDRFFLRTSLEFITCFWRDKGDEEFVIEARLRIHAPKGEVEDVFIRDIGDEAFAENTSSKLAVIISAIEFHGVGAYSMELSSRKKGGKIWKKVSSTPLIVRLNRKLEATAPEQPSAPTLASPPVSS